MRRRPSQPEAPGGWHAGRMKPGPPVHSGRPLFRYASTHGTAKFSQIEAKLFFASASSKQKRVPLSACSIHQSTLFPMQCGRRHHAADPVFCRRPAQSNHSFWSRKHLSKIKQRDGPGLGANAGGTPGPLRQLRRRASIYQAASRAWVPKARRLQPQIPALPYLGICLCASLAAWLSFTLIY